MKNLNEITLQYKDNLAQELKMTSSAISSSDDLQEILAKVKSVITADVLAENKKHNNALSSVTKFKKELDKRDAIFKAIEEKYSILTESFKRSLEKTMTPGRIDNPCMRYSIFKSMFGYGCGLVELYREKEEYRELILSIFKEIKAENKALVESILLTGNEESLCGIFEIPETEDYIVKLLKYVLSEYDTMFWKTDDARYVDHDGKKKRYLFEIGKVIKDYSHYAFYKTFEGFENTKSLPSVSDFIDKLKVYQQIANKLLIKKAILSKFAFVDK